MPDTDDLKTILFIVSFVIISLGIIYGLFTFLNPDGFTQTIITLLLCVIFVPIGIVAYIIFIAFIMEMMT